MSYSEEDFYKFVGEKIKIARQAVGMNQSDLARVVNLQRTSITNIEAGQQKVQAYTLQRIAEAVRVSILSLLPPVESILPETNKEDLIKEQEVLDDSGDKSGLTDDNVKNILKVLK